jgi:hypothetical protein
MFTVLDTGQGPFVMSARVVIVSPRGARPKIDAKDGEHSILKALWGSGRKNTHFQ